MNEFTVVVYYPGSGPDGLCYTLSLNKYVQSVIEDLRKTGRCVTATFPYGDKVVVRGLMQAVCPRALYK